MSNKYQPRTILHQLLDKQRMSQRYFAELLQVDSPSASMYLSGKRLPNPETIKCMAELLQVDHDYLVGVVVGMNLKRQYSASVRNCIADQLKKDIEDEFVARTGREF